MKQTDKHALLDWEKYRQDIMRSTPVDKEMSVADREKHRIYLEARPIEWIEYFFPNYAKYEFADFQKRAIHLFTVTRATPTRSAISCCVRFSLR